MLEVGVYCRTPTTPSRGGYARSLASCSTFIVELWVVLDGLLLARRLSITKLEIHVDSFAV